MNSLIWSPATDVLSDSEICASSGIAQCLMDFTIVAFSELNIEVDFARVCGGIVLHFCPMER